MDPKVSVIIPVYNTSFYLKECIESVLNQFFLDFEIIIINDGSTDDSGKICEEYAKCDKRIHLYHQKNQGVSAARNYGIQKAKGEWLVFLDSDDFVDKSYLSDFFSNLSGRTELVIQGMNKYSTKVEMFYEFSKREIISRDKFLQQYEIIPYFFGPVSKLYKREIIKKNNLQFDNSKSFAEDTLFNLDYLSWCNNEILIINQRNYYYRATPNSLSSQKLNFAERHTLFLDVKSRLQTLTGNKKHYYWYSAELLRALYADSSIRKKRKILGHLIREHHEQLVIPFRESKLSSNLIFRLIKTKNIFILNILFKWSHRKKNH